MLDKLIKEVVEWNKVSLPENTLKKQLNKMEEEMKEIHKATNQSERFSEWVDVFIAVIGLKRFSEVYFYRYMGYLLENQRYPLNEIIEKAFKKMEVNKCRKWVIKYGVYHHEEIN